jgi:hypothetical protein
MRLGTMAKKYDEVKVLEKGFSTRYSIFSEDVRQRLLKADEEGEKNDKENTELVQGEERAKTRKREEPKRLYS